MRAYHLLHGDEAGNTLIEILITIVVVSIGVVGIMPALANSLSLTDRYSKHSKVDQALTQVVELIQNTPYVCAGTSSYDAVLAPLATSSKTSITVSKIEYWTTAVSGNSFTVLPAPVPPATCPVVAPNNGPVFKTQRITVAVASTDNRGRQSVEVVKRP